GLFTLRRRAPRMGAQHRRRRAASIFDHVPKIRGVAEQIEVATLKKGDITRLSRFVAADTPYIYAPIPSPCPADRCACCARSSGGMRRRDRSVDHSPGAAPSLAHLT